MERETGFEPATSSLGRHTYVGPKSLARFCCEFLNLHHLAESAISEPVPPNEAQTRQLLHLRDSGMEGIICFVMAPHLDTFRTFVSQTAHTRTNESPFPLNSLPI